MPSFNDTLKDIFNKRVPRYNTSTLAATTSTNATSTSQSPSPTPSSSPSKSSSISKGAIAGAVVGAIAGTGVIGLVAYVFIRRRRGGQNKNKSLRGLLEKDGTAGSSRGDASEIHEKQSRDRLQEKDSQVVTEKDSSPLVEAGTEPPVFELHGTS